MRLYSLTEEFQGRVTLQWKGYPLIPGEAPGRKATAHSAQGRMRAGAEAEREGIEFRPWPEDKDYPKSSLPGLEAAKCARLQGEEAFKRYDLALFKAVYTDCHDISEREVLVDIAREVGLDTSRFAQDLDSGSQKRLVIAEFLECVQKYNSWAQGIPLATFNDGPPLVGCAPASSYRTAIIRHLDPLSALG